MTKKRVPWADGLEEPEQRTFIAWALADQFVLPSPFALHDSNPNYELAAYRFWAEIEDEAMERWIDHDPGSRPSGWWWWRSGREPLRLRIGGSGEAEWTDYAGKVTPNTGRHPFKPFAAPGISRRSPEMQEVTPELPRYQGTWRGLPVAGWTGIDPDDLPTYESEAAYLDRRKLLLPEEKRRLSDDDFEPVALVLTHSFSGGLVGVAET